MSSSSLDEKEKGYMGDPQAAVEDTREYEPIKSEPVAEKDLEAQGNLGRRSTRESLSRMESSTSGYSQFSSDVSTTKSTTKGKKRWYKRANPLKWGSKPPIPQTRMVSPEYSASFFSRLYFHWMNPLMIVGYKRPLEHNDIWLVNPERSTDVMVEKLQAAFKIRLEQGNKRPLLAALYDTFKVEFVIGGLCQLLASVVQSVAPFVLRFLITFAAKAYYAQVYGGPAPHIGEGIGLVIGITAMQFVQSMATNHFMYRGMMVGGQSRAVLISIIFDKAMKLSGRAKAGGKALLDAPPPDIKPGSEAEKKWYKKLLKKKQKEASVPEPAAGVSGDGHGWGNGRIINLMSTDTYRVDQASGFFHMIWCSPIAILVTIVLLLVNLTYSALPGLGLLILVMPLLGRAVKTLFRRRQMINKITDQRVSLTQEILQAVRFVKYFGWETSFLERIAEIRRNEIHGVQVLLAIRNGILAVGMSMPVFASMLSFITYSLTDHGLNPGPIFSSLALFNSLRLPLNFLPLVIGQVIDANASVKRIQEFLLAEEAQEDVNWDMNAQDAVVLKNADFTWERHPTRDEDDSPIGDKGVAKKSGKDKSRKNKRESVQSEYEKGGSEGSSTADTPKEEEEEQPFEIKDFNISIGRKELVAVIGGVGSGKSSFLAALAGDMRKTQGEVTIGASRAFCPQYAWIQNANVRDNITFGKEFEPKWYNKVIDACALRPDLEMLPNGDKTEIGERGITVSGGQKQRMNIARAIYFDADIVLMDDPLSAVDAHVGRHIMDNAICGLLADKCRILATHQLHVLSRCDRIIWVEEGRIQAVDTFNNLMAHNEDFQKLMLTTASEELEEEEEDVNEDKREGEKKKQTKKKGKKPAAALMQVEDRATKSVSWGVWTAYIKAGGGIWVGPLVLLLLILSQGTNIVTSLWLSWWTSDKFHYSRGTYVSRRQSQIPITQLTLF
jgi:ATP-binding cassette subfamily C (CFTR/MRP) protein 1